MEHNFRHMWDNLHLLENNLEHIYILDINSNLMLLILLAFSTSQIPSLSIYESVGYVVIDL